VENSRVIHRFILRAIVKNNMKEEKKTVVLGASPNPERYSNLAVSRLRQRGHPVIAIGVKEGKIDDVDIQTKFPEERDVDTITMYLNPMRQKQYYDYILSLKPKRIIFNPGAENPELEELAQKNNIEPIEACTLVMLSTGQY
jgi:hypothetical protein